MPLTFSTDADYYVPGKTLPDWAADFDCSSWAQFNLKYLLGHPAVTSYNFV